MSKKKEKCKSKSHRNNWIIFSQSYLLLAKLACQELLDERDIKHSRMDNEWLGPLPYTPRDLFIPIRYNINHGIEIFIKTLLVILESPYDDESHDLIKLFDDFKYEIKKLIKKEKTEEEKCSDGNKIKKQDVERLRKNINDLEKLIKKYFHNKSIPKKHVSDSKNSIYRYPDNSIGIDFNFKDKILPSISEREIKVMQKDIKKLYLLFNDVGFILDIYKH